MATIGFHTNRENLAEETRGFRVHRKERSYGVYLGKPVRLRTTRDERYGIFRGIEGEDMVLQPSVVIETIILGPGREEITARIENEVPSSILAYHVLEIDKVTEDFMAKYVSSLNSASNRLKLGLIT